MYPVIKIKIWIRDWYITSKTLIVEAWLDDRIIDFNVILIIYIDNFFTIKIIIKYINSEIPAMYKIVLIV